MSLRFRDFAPYYACVFFVIFILTLWTDHSVTAFSQKETSRTIIIIDAGHGGEDGGAVSCTGVEEAHLNLQISLRMNDLLHLLGYKTKMLRIDDNDLHTEGSTISQRKNSDLRQRVKLINETDNGVLLSIHQNQFSDSRYSGAQVFWASTDGSKELADDIQSAFVSTLNTASKRAAKQAKGIYLTEHIHCTGVLVECGFLSNPTEEALLRSCEYQQKIVCVLAAAVIRNLESRNASA